MTGLDDPATSVNAQLAAVRSELDQVRKELAATIDHLLPAAPGLFEPGHTYALHHAQFQCVIVTTAPDNTEPVAWGWSTHNVTCKTPWTHRSMTTRTYQQWKDSGALDLTTGTPLGDPQCEPA